MTHTFIHIATVIFENNYFNDGIFRSLKVNLKANSTRELRDLGIVVKEFVGGFHILTSQLDQFNSLQQEAPLRFELRCDDPYFINYTELSTFAPSHSLIYINNLEIFDTEEAAVKKLHTNYIDDDNIVTVVNNEVVLNAYQEGETYQFESDSIGILDFNHILQIEEKNRYVLSQVPEGIIRVYNNDTLVERFYHNRDSLWRKPIAVLDVYPSKLYDHYIELNTTLTYSVQFKARETVWEYYISHENISQYNNLDIIDIDKSQPFIRKHQSDFVVFRSKIALSLAEASHHHFKLVHNFNEDEQEETIIINQLPVPSANQLWPNDEWSNEHLVSRIYIQI